jgi:AcrR family transcriptional regulator
LEKPAPAFGKGGRPREDRLLRQREIYQAVAPLLVRVGPRRLTMRAAAAAACVGVGTLYHYFPTKRDLVLHGLATDARDRLCRELRARLDAAGGDTVERYLDTSAAMFAFARPAALAALELGGDELRAALEEGLRDNVRELRQTLRRVAPELTAHELTRLGRAVRRVAFAFMIDRRADPADVRDQIGALVAGYRAQARAEHAAISA